MVGARVFELLRGFCATEGRSVVLVTPAAPMLPGRQGMPL